MIHRILVPLDGSTRAEAVLPHVVAIATVFRSRVDLLHVLPGTAVGDRYRPSDPMSCRLARANRSRYLAGRARIMAGEGLDVHSRTLEGGPAEVIVDLASGNDYDLVALTPHGTGQSRHLAMGCTATGVVLNARCSTLLAMGSKPGPDDAEVPPVMYRKILSPVDCSPRSDWCLKVASDLARGSGARLQAVHVLDPPQLVSRMPLDEATRALVDGVVRANRAEATQYLDSIVRRLGGDGATMESRVLPGSAGGVAQVVCRRVASEGIDLVVLSAHGRGQSSGGRIGGTAMELLLGVHRPVLILQDPAAGSSHNSPRNMR
ncbi:MAG: universal stress protein [Gemmatimonadales bacterium]|nr:MAG: universal stress protein [Gemmatimonadales bacterium]